MATASTEYSLINGAGSSSSKYTVHALAVSLALAVATIVVLCGIIANVRHEGPFNLDNEASTCILPKPDIDRIEMIKDVQHRLISGWFTGDEYRNTAIVLRGGVAHMRNFSDTEIDFRQDSNFLWLTGIEDIDCFYAIILGAKPQTVLFAPHYEVKHAIWNSHIRTLAEWQQLYKTDFAAYDKDMASFLSDKQVSKVFMLPGQDFPGRSNFQVDVKKFKAASMDARPVKTPHEVEMMRYAIGVGTGIHNYLIKNLRPGYWEYEIESLFRFFSWNCDMRRQAYPPIVGTGPNGATLHYNANNRQSKDGDLLLIDAGPEYHGYSADITRTYPLNGKFTDEQKMIYNIVLKANKACIEMLKPGVNFDDANTLSRTIVAQGLVDAGLVKGSVSDLMANKVTQLFYPHHLGHYMGVDVHDTYSLPNKPLEAGIIVTVEPGIYFIPEYLEPYLDPSSKLAKFLVPDRIRSFYQFGGVRIEDDILITSSGYEVLTTSPKEVDDIELLMQN